MVKLLKKLNLEGDVLAELEGSFNDILHRREIVVRLSGELSDMGKRLDPDEKSRDFQSLMTQCQMLIHLSRKDGQATFVPYALAAIDYLTGRFRHAKSTEDIDYVQAGRVVEEIFRLFNIDSDLQEALGDAG